MAQYEGLSNPFDMTDTDEVSGNERLSNSAGSQDVANGVPSWTRKLLRYATISTVLVAFAGLAVDRVITGFIDGSGFGGPSGAQQSSMRGTVELDAEPRQMTPFRDDASCPADGSVCICTTGYAVTGKDATGYNIITPAVGSSACQPWVFKIGDMIFVDKPSGNQVQYREANIVAKFTGTPVVHNAIVTSIPPAGTPQTGENVMVTEALKGQWKRVVQNSMRTVVERYPFGGVSIRRVDAARYPNFFAPATAAAITAWATSVLGQPFDSDMVNPLKRGLYTQGRNFANNPSCSERVRAHAMYTAGGPGQWICSQFMAWTIAFPGGLNLQGPDDPFCSEPQWTVTNLEPNPGEDLIAPFVQAGDWKVPCDTAGCFIGQHPGGAAVAAPVTAPVAAPAAPAAMPVPAVAAPTAPVVAPAACTWTSSPGYALNFAGGVTTVFASQQLAEAQCIQLGKPACQAVTCYGPTQCTVRASPTFTPDAAATSYIPGVGCYR